MNTQMAGTLFLISTPIGNPDDITLRAINTLKNADLVVCEEWKVGKQLLKYLNIENDMLNLNEHNTKEQTPELVELLKSGKNLALISDCGTPVFSDPGFALVKSCYAAHIQVTAVPGASSLMAALILSGYELDEFLYLGWLPRKKEDRLAKIRLMKSERRTTILMETPYRLIPLLEQLEKELGEKRKASLCCDLTKENELVLRGNLGSIKKQAEAEGWKREFVLVLGGYA